MTAALDGEYCNLWPLAPHFNAGFMVIETDEKLFDDIFMFSNTLDVDNVKNFAGKDYVIADQELLNLYYKDWKDYILHLKHYLDNYEKIISKKTSRMKNKQKEQKQEELTKDN